MKDRPPNLIYLSMSRSRHEISFSFFFLWDCISVIKKKGDLPSERLVFSSDPT